jgi:hypothetical protein
VTTQWELKGVVSSDLTEADGALLELSRSRSCPVCPIRLLKRVVSVAEPSESAAVVVHVLVRHFFDISAFRIYEIK